MTKKTLVACAVCSMGLVIALAGCSFMTMERATVRGESQLMPTCTQSIKPIIADGLGLVFWSWLFATEARDALDEYEQDHQLSDQFYGAMTSVGGMLAHVASGLWGYRAQNQCRVARQAHERRIEPLVKEDR